MPGMTLVTAGSLRQNFSAATGRVGAFGPQGGVHPPGAAGAALVQEVAALLVLIGRRVAELALEPVGV